MTTITRKTLLAVLVFSGGVLAVTREDSAEPSEYRGLPTDDSLEQLLARDDIAPMHGAPVIRFDHAAYSDAASFVQYGPQVEAALAPGHVDLERGGVQHYDDTEFWLDLGQFSKVAPDVYARLARMANIPVEYLTDGDTHR
jgi:hypothetical protein